MLFLLSVTTMLEVAVVLEMWTPATSNVAPVVSTAVVVAAPPLLAAMAPELVTKLIAAWAFPATPKKSVKARAHANEASRDPE